MKKVIIFDFDGTIADTLEPALEITNRLLLKEGFPKISGKELRELRNMGPLQILTHFKFPIWKLPKLVRGVRDELAKVVEKIDIFPGIEKLIIDLKLQEHHLAILSSNLPETIDKFLKRYQLPVFEYIKCEPNILEKHRLIKNFLQEHKLEKQDVIYIGDEVRDIEACRHVGVQIISVTWGFNDAAALKRMKPNFLVDKPSEILRLLKKK